METAQKSIKKIGKTDIITESKSRHKFKSSECENYGANRSDGNILVFPALPVFPYQAKASYKDVQNDCKTEKGCAQWLSNVLECDV